MIGELINKFETGDQTVEEFNKLFRNCQIKEVPTEHPLYDIYLAGHEQVTIGEPLLTNANIRLLTILGRVFPHAFSPAEEWNVNKVCPNSKHVKVWDAAGNFIGQFVGLGNAAIKIGITREQFNYRTSVGKYIVEELAKNVEDEDEE